MAPTDATPPLPRHLVDPHDMRALAHPTRLALLEVLAVHGPLTATQAGALIGESPSSCSFHLRTLARHDFVEETGDGVGRQRPWRLVHLGTTIPELDDPEATVAADVLSAMYRARQLARLEQWHAQRAGADPVWRAASTASEYMVWVTAEELEEVNVAVGRVLARHVERLVAPALRPDGARLVELLYFAYPVAVGQGAATGEG